MQAATGGIERQLADRNSHAARALVAEAQNALAIGDDDRFDTVEMRIGQDAPDAILMRDAQKQSARLAKDAAELLAAETHRRGVDDRQRFAEIAHQQGIEQHLIAVLQPAQEHIPREIIRQLAQRQQPAADLILEACDVRRQQAVQLENVAFLLGECGTLVEQRIVQERVPVQMGLDERFFRRAGREAHCGARKTARPWEQDAAATS